MQIDRYIDRTIDRPIDRQLDGKSIDSLKEWFKNNIYGQFYWAKVLGQQGEWNDLYVEKSINVD